MKKLKFRRPTDAEFQFEFSYFFRGEWTDEKEKQYIQLANKELQKYVVFKPWKIPVAKQSFDASCEVEFIAQVVRITIRGDYL